MAAKSDKKSINTYEATGTNTGKVAGKSKKNMQEDDGMVETDELVLKPDQKFKGAAKDEDDDEIEEDVVEDVDDSGKQDEEDDWDPDFDEFDLPKSTKKAVGGKKVKDEDEDDFKVDEDFKDLFGDSSGGFDSHEDDY